MLTSRVQQRQVGNWVRITDNEVENYLQAQAGPAAMVLNTAWPISLSR